MDVGEHTDARTKIRTDKEMCVIHYIFAKNILVVSFIDPHDT